MSELAPTAAECIVRIREILSEARSQAMQSVNVVMIAAYWHIGREIRQTLSAELEDTVKPLSPLISWSHYCQLMKVSSLEARSFYEQECIKASTKKKSTS